VRLSFCLLDWDCREDPRPTFQIGAAAHRHEVLWINLGARPLDANRAPANLRTFVQGHNCRGGHYHKHQGYNFALKVMTGDILVIHDSDACVHPQLWRGIAQSFHKNSSKVVYAYQKRSYQEAPKGRAVGQTDLARFEPYPTQRNYGATMAITRENAIRLGGFDESEDYRGYICGPYELGWRALSAGLQEEWLSPELCSYHYAHPNPNERGRGGEISGPHFHFHAVRALENLLDGRVQPHKPAPEILTLGKKYGWKLFPERNGRKISPSLPRLSPYLTRLLADYARSSRGRKWAARLARDPQFAPYDISPRSVMLARIIREARRIFLKMGKIWLKKSKRPVFA
jgi:hypothetical protein